MKRHLIAFPFSVLIGEINKTVDWVQTIESMIQLHILKASYGHGKTVEFPFHATKLIIDSPVHMSYKKSLAADQRKCHFISTLISFRVVGLLIPIL